MGPTPANSLFIQNNCSRFPVQRTGTEQNEKKERYTGGGVAEPAEVEG